MFREDNIFPPRAKITRTGDGNRERETISGGRVRGREGTERKNGDDDADDDGVSLEIEHDERKASTSE